MKTILLADADEVMQDLMAHRLRADGYAAATVASAGALTDFLDLGNHADLIVLDLMLPGGGSFELVRTLIDHPAIPAVPILIISARQTAEDIEHARALGVAGYIGKPFDPEQAMGTISALLAADLTQNSAAA